MNILLSLIVFLNLQEIVQRSDLDKNMPRILCSISWVESNHKHIFKPNNYFGTMQIHRTTSEHIWTRIVKNKIIRQTYNSISSDLIRYLHYNKQFNILSAKIYIEWLFDNTKNIKTSIIKYNTGYWSKKTNQMYFYLVDQAYQKICKTNDYNWINDVYLDIRF